FATQFGSTRASGEWTVSGREIVDAHGLEILSSVIDLEANGTLHTNPIPLPFALSVQNTTSYRLEGDPWQFPLAVGATASLSTRMNFSEDFRLVYYGVSPTPTHVAGLAWSNMTYDIQAAVGIDTPAGHFEAYPIRETFADGSFTVSFFAPVAGTMPGPRPTTARRRSGPRTSSATGIRRSNLRPSSASRRTDGPLPRSEPSRWAS